MILRNAETKTAGAGRLSPSVTKALAVLDKLADYDYLTLRQLSSHAGVSTATLDEEVCTPPLCDLRLDGGPGKAWKYVSPATKALADQEAQETQ